MGPELEELTELLGRGGPLVVFSGAGMSTESGIPDYRSPGGVWTRHRPIAYPEFLASRGARVEYWHMYAEWLPGFLVARPHAGHLALGRLAAAGLLRGVVTQNIDGLHAAGGVQADRVLELHGNLVESACTGCGGHREPTARALERFAADGLPPECPRCGAPLKPRTISFGQSLEPAVLERAAAWCREAGLLLVVGSSLTVTPAAELPRHTLEAGGRLAIINRDPTYLDGRAAMVWRAPAGRALAALAGRLLGES